MGWGALRDSSIHLRPPAPPTGIGQTRWVQRRGFDPRPVGMEGNPSEVWGSDGGQPYGVGMGRGGLTWMGYPFHTSRRS